MASRSTKVQPLGGESSAVPRRGRREIELEDFTGHTAAAAVELARAAGIRPAPERIEVAEAESYGLVVAQDPKAGATATRGALVALYVGAPATHSIEDAEPPLAEPPADNGAAGAAPEPARGTEDEPGLSGGLLGEPDELRTPPLDAAPIPADDPLPAPGPAWLGQTAARDQRSRVRRRAAASAAVTAALFAVIVLTTHEAPRPDHAPATEKPNLRDKRPIRRRPQRKPRRAPERRGTRARTSPPSPTPSVSERRTAPVPRLTGAARPATRAWPPGAQLRHDEFF